MKLPAGWLPGCALVLDDYLVRAVYDLRSAHGNPPHDEVWEGLLVLKPLPDNDHQRIQGQLLFALAHVEEGGLRPGVNVSDRASDWMANFRCPDVVLYRADNPAVNHNSHWQGGPDFLVEIVTPNDLSRDKLDFYAKVNTREVLIVDRDPWALELYQLAGGVLQPAGRSDLANPAVLASGVLPLTFQLQAGTPRPTILVTHTATGQTWTA